MSLHRVTPGRWQRHAIGRLRAAAGDGKRTSAPSFTSAPPTSLTPRGLTAGSDPFAERRGSTGRGRPPGRRVARTKGDW